jgi:Tol biopolymer transport system component/DNA-binding winged helix-turn-helix (wHTH) protein
MPTTNRKDAPFPAPRPQRITFDRFELDLRSGELRKSGHRIRLQAQPFQLLTMLLQHAGEVVTREEVCRRLWPDDTFVDFDHSLAAAVNKIREALADSAENPKYVETLPKRGYRFVGNISPEALAVMPWSGAHQPADPLPAPTLVSDSLSKTRWDRRVALFFTILLTAAAIAWAWLSHKSPNSDGLAAVPFTSYPGQEVSPAISPDGSRVAFGWDNTSLNTSGVASYDLYVKAIGSETLLRLTNHPAEFISSVWSPDGTQIAFHRIAGPDTGIYVVPVLGGPERRLLSTRTPYDLASPLSWSPDGKRIAYSDHAIGHTGNTNFLLNMESLETHELPHDPACIHEGNPTFSHSGRQLALLCVHSTANFEYFVADVSGNSKRSLASVHEFPTGIAWTADDKYLIVSRTLAMGPELDKLRVSDGSLQKIPVSMNGSWPSITPDGRKLAFSSIAFHNTLWRKDLLRPDVVPVRLYASTLQENEGRYSPDGKRVVFDSARSGVWSVWMADVDGSNLAQLSHGGPAGFPQWSPDSQKIAFQMEEGDGSTVIYVSDIVDRVPRKLPTRFRRATSPSWSRDGRSIYFRTYEGVGQQIYRASVGGGDATLIAASDTINVPIESPDGKSLYFMPLYGDAPLMILPLDQPNATPQPVPDMSKLSSEYQWTVVPDGIFFAPQSTPRTICFFSFVTRKTRELFKSDHDLSDGMSVSPDGRYMLFSQLDENSSNIMLVNNFR